MPVEKFLSIIAIWMSFSLYKRHMEDFLPSEELHSLQKIFLWKIFCIENLFRLSINRRLIEVFCLYSSEFEEDLWKTNEKFFLCRSFGVFYNWKTAFGKSEATEKFSGYGKTLEFFCPYESSGKYSVSIRPTKEMWKDFFVTYLLKVIWLCRVVCLKRAYKMHSWVYRRPWKD